MPQREEEKQ